jgi:hypothetical protein
MATRLTAGDSLIIGCLSWLLVIGACATIALVAITLWLTRT